MSPLCRSRDEHLTLADRVLEHGCTTCGSVTVEGAIIRRMGIQYLMMWRNRFAIRGVFSGMGVRWRIRW